MQPSIYKFYINGVEVHPHYKTLSKKYEKENNQIFFRESMEGEMKLYGADYFLVKNSSIYTEHTFLVQKKNGNAYEDYFVGTFNKTDCEIDNDKRECKLKVAPKDMYSEIMNNYSNEYNLSDLAPALTSVTVGKRPVLQIYVLEDNVISNFLPNGVTWEMEVESDKGLIELFEECYFGLESRHIEVRIDNGGEYDGVYAGKGWSSATLISPMNNKYKIVGTVELSGNDYTYYLHLFDINDTLLANKLYTTGTLKSNSRYATLTFYNPSNINDTFLAEVSMETVLARILTGASVTHDGLVAEGEIAEGSFGYLDNYTYVYSPIIGTSGYALSSVIMPALSEVPTPYGKGDNGYYFTAPIATVGVYYPFAKSTWIYSSRWVYLNEVFSRNFDLYGSVYREIKDCIHIGDIIKALLKKLSPTITHEATPEYSQFLYGEDNPIYGEKFELFITQKTHIKKFIYDTPATKTPITFEQVMNMLSKCFRCYWYIEDNKLKIEHLYYFDNGRSYDSSNTRTSIDITSIYNNKNGLHMGYGQNSIKYDKNSLPSRYEFGYMDESSVEFDSAAVKLLAPYLQQDKTENINTDVFSADIDMIISNTISISDEGFALIAAKEYRTSENKYYSTFNYEMELISEAGKTYTVSLQNGVLSWYYLFNFYSTNLPSTIAEYDGYPKKTIYVTGITRCMNQSVKIPMEADPDLYALVKTDIGEGQINEVSIDITTRQVTMDLLFEPK